MRISRLDLKRYGKFTDQSISLPSGTRDFHLIVGPNEAGKSTLRDAIQDLLFGIKTQSRYNFLHPHSEMCLGALIEQADDKLDFIRTKARTKTLQTQTGTVLPDNVLLPFLGQVDRTFFDQMFGLNHERLVTGGQEILSASNDIGQILFQAAAGIGGLGDIRDRLEAEADKLWAKRKSNDREYYIASAELDQAEAALKLATVRTKDWQEARAKVDQIAEELKLARDRYQALEQERVQLERVRRVAPMLISIADLELRLADLGNVVSLPDNAAGQLTNAEREIAIATQSLKLYKDQATELLVKIKAINPVASVLARTEDIDALAETRQQLRNHESDIGKREEEVRVLWQAVQESVRQLGWPEASEESVGQRLPSTLVRAAIDNLVRRNEALAQALLTAEDNFKKSEEDAKTIDAEIAALPVTEIPVTLIDALATARALGDVATQEKRFESQIGRLKRDLVATTAELGDWNPGLDSLRKLLPPTQDETSSLIKRRSELELAVSTGNERLAEVQAEIQAMELEVSQYKAAHNPVTLDDVQHVRTNRDSLWHAIKDGSRALTDAAPEYEVQVEESDVLSDKRHDKAQEETELQSRLDRSQQLRQKCADIESRMREHTLALTKFDQSWQERAKSMGLAGMTLLKVNEWRSARERVLTAATALAEAESAREDLVQSVAHARSGVTNAVLPIKPEAESLSLTALILLADGLVTETTRILERRRALSSQKVRAEAALPDLRARVEQTKTAIDKWREDLQKNLLLAHLADDLDIGTIEGALGLFEDMHQKLQKIRDIRNNRIDMMRRDLDVFDRSAKLLAADISPELAIESAAQIALALASRLKQESASSQELDRLNAELAKAQKQAQGASGRIAEANAGLEPLLRLSGALDHDALRIAIDNSDRQRSFTAEIDQATKQMLGAGDGLDRDGLKSEFAAFDVNLIPSRLSDIKGLVEEIVGQQNRLSGEQSSAEAVLGKIAGQDEAARAESLRQQALARMSNATERYIKVFTAAKLLRWSIERFRESKQGPMLARASEVFSGLTQGAFTRLVVDYETEPLKLSGQRATGGSVDIDGMSEGTRDQLYLALRLAALELHLEQAVALPFIADDLFINYDDGRAKAGLEALAKLSEMTQVIFLSHHEHLVPVAKSVFGEGLSIIKME